MAKAAPKTPASPTPPRGAAEAQQNTIDKMMQEWRQKPGRLLGWAATILVALLAAWLGNHFFSKSRLEAGEEFLERLSKASSEEDLGERARMLANLADSIEGEPQESFVLLEQIRTTRAAALQADDPAERLEHFRGCLKAAQDLKALGDRSMYNRIPRRPPGMTAGMPKTVADEVIEYAQKQIAWLESTQAAAAPSADPGLSVTITLADAEGKEFPLQLALYSGEAPQSVHTLLELFRSGVWDGCKVFGLQQDDPNTDENHAVLLGSAFSKLAPDRPEIWGSADDWVGFTIPAETNRLKAKRGSVALERRVERSLGMGSAPLSLVVILMDEANVHQRTLVGEVVESASTLEALDRLQADKDKPLATDQVRAFPPKTPWTIKSVAITGTPAHPDPGGLRRAYREPTVPEKTELPK